MVYNIINKTKKGLIIMKYLYVYGNYVEGQFLKSHDKIHSTSNLSNKRKINESRNCKYLQVFKILDSASIYSSLELLYEEDINLNL